ncbi:MAG: hypothetical protein WCK86_22110 [Planctomycetia bacterium]
MRQIPVSHVGEFIKLALDDSPTKRYGPKVQLAGMHHNPTPGPSGSEFLYGHVWVTISWLVKHPQWGCIGMPLLALMYVRQKDLQILERIGKAPWKFRTKLELAAELVEWCWCTLTSHLPNLEPPLQRRTTALFPRSSPTELCCTSRRSDDDSSE